MAYNITDNANWLSVSPTGGSSSGAAQPHAVSYNVAALAVGAHSGTITISAPSADNSPLTIAVNLTVNPFPYAPVGRDRDGDVDHSDFGWFQACYSGPGVAQIDPQCAKARLDFDSDVDQDDFARFLQCMLGPGVPAAPDCAGSM
jgi:hypothetical protein